MVPGSTQVARIGGTFWPSANAATELLHGIPLAPWGSGLPDLDFEAFRAGDTYELVQVLCGA